MFKTTGLQVRRDGLTHQQYVDHWLNIHAPMSDGVDGLRGYVSNEVVLAGAGVGVPCSHPDFGATLDGIAQLHFDTQDGLMRMAETPQVQAWFADGPNFVGLRTGFVVEETVVRSPGVGAARLPFKAFCFVNAPVQVIDVVGDGALVRSRVAGVTGSTNLPGFEVPDVTQVVELWAVTQDGVVEAARAFGAEVPGALVGVVITRERIIHQPPQ
jgi:hypothetical protein